MRRFEAVTDRLESGSGGGEEARDVGGEVRDEEKVVSCSYRKMRGCK